MRERFPVDEDLRHGVRHGGGNQGHRSDLFEGKKTTTMMRAVSIKTMTFLTDLETRPDHDEEVADVLVGRHRVVELIPEALAEKDDVWFHDS